jgi:hypothetical protein
MRDVSDAWAPLVAAYRHGLGVEDFLAVLLPSRNLVLTPSPWPEGWLPAGMLVYPYLAPMGQGVGSISIELADDRSSRLGTVTCAVRVQAGQVGTPLDAVQQLLLTLSEQPAVVWGGFLGGAAHTDSAILPLFSGRVQAPRLVRGVLTFTIVDGLAQDHRDIEVPLGTSVFPGAPLDARGLAIPLVIGTALGVSPTLVASVANGTLATPLPASAVETVNLTETGATFPAAGAIVVGSETITYSGRRVGLLLDGVSALQLLSPVRSAPVAHLAGEAVTLAPPIVYRYLIGLGLTPLELLAVRDQDGVIATYTFVTDPPGLPAGTAVLEVPTAHEGVQVDVQVIPVPPLPPLLNGGFETGTLAPWTASSGTTAAVVAQEVQAGSYKLQLQNVGPTLVGVTQDVAVEVGERYVLLLNWRTPVQMTGNLLENGDFTDPTEVIWQVETEGMEHAEPSYEPGTVNEHGSQVFTLPFAPVYEDIPDDPTSTFRYRAAGYTSYHLTMEQALTLTPGQAVALDVRVSALLLTGRTDLVYAAGAGAGGASLGVSLGSLPPLSEVTVEVLLWPVLGGGRPEYQRYLQPDQPASQYGRQAEFRLQSTVTPAQSAYRFVIDISGRYIGTIPPIEVTTAVVSVAP